MSQQLETEFTFEPVPDTELPDLSGTPGIATVTKPRVQRLEAVYFDTDDLRLARAGVTLRRRTGGDDAGWHLKVPEADDNGRTEVHAPLGRSARQAPKPMRDAVVPWTRNSPLSPVATVRTRRELRGIRDQSRGLVAELCEDSVHGISHLHGHEGEQAWTEWELELGPAATDDLTESMIETLSGVGGPPSTGSSKLPRTLGAALPPGPLVPELGAEPSADEVVHARVAAQVRALLIRDSEVRRDVGDGVHKARVAMRRLRAALATFRPWLERATTDRLRDELRWAGRALSSVRDAEVLRERFQIALASQSAELVVGPVRREIDLAGRTARREARERALQVMESARYLRLLARLEALAEGRMGWAEEGPGRKRLRKRTEREWRRVSERYDTAHTQSDDGVASAPGLHDVRKAVKRLRYAAEAIEPVYGKPANELASRAEDVQTVLGEHQDSVVARPVLRSLAMRTYGAGGNAFTHGRLHGLEDQAAARARRDFVDVWSRLEELDPGSVLR